MRFNIILQYHGEDDFTFDTSSFNNCLTEYAKKYKNIKATFNKNTDVDGTLAISVDIKEPAWEESPRFKYIFGLLFSSIRFNPESFAENIPSMILSVFTRGLDYACYHVLSDMNNIIIPFHFMAKPHLTTTSIDLFAFFS